MPTRNRTSSMLATLPSFLVMLASPISIYEREDLADCLPEHIRGQIANAPRLSHAPVEPLDLIGKDRSLDTQPVRDQHFKGISLHSRRDGAAQGQSHATVV